MKPNNTFCYGITKNIYNDILKDNYDAIWIYGNAEYEDKVKLVRQQLYLWMVPDSFIHVHLNTFFDKGYLQLFTGMRAWLHDKVLVINVDALFLKNINFIYDILEFVVSRHSDVDCINLSSYVDGNEEYITFYGEQHKQVNIENMIFYHINSNAMDIFMSNDNVTSDDIYYVRTQYPLAIKNEYDKFKDKWSLWNTEADPLKYNFLY